MSILNNIGEKDKIFRFTIGLIFIVLGMKISVWWFVPAIYMILTIIVGWSPLYSLFKIKT